MKILLNYLYDYRKTIVLWIALGMLNLFIGFLYHFPIERSMLWLVLSGFIGVLVGIYDFIGYTKSYNDIERMKKQIQIETKQLPHPRNQIEKEYGKVIKKMSDQLYQTENNAKKNEQDILEYYTLWVHQIKTPISALHLILQDEESESAEEMKAQLFNIEQYVELVLQYLRLESTSTDYLFQKIELDELISDVVKKYAPFFIRKRLSLRYEKVNYQVLSDSKWLTFVLEQIVSNSLKYTKKGSISIYLRDKDTLVIEDTGIGINPEDIPRIGEKNFTGYVGRKNKNATGIGLYLCKKILTKLGHALTIESEPDKGTKVSIKFDSRAVTIE
ncbi:sensor histidine kinase [Enterococcus malodoratus]|uniref:sensor histidine kinase n=1 Tax=Enterococcus malodoratus TaxID=71451 RepID=UPI002073DB30|nr:sensor histidine kinase [Enterococcus malodoratus]